MAKYSWKHFTKNADMESENASLKADKENLLASVKQLEAKVSEADKTMAALPLAKQEWEAEMAKVKAEAVSSLENVKKDYETKIEALNTELASTKVSVDKQVVASLAGVGIQAGTVKEESTAKVLTTKEAVAHLGTLKGKEAQDFYKTNKTLFESYMKNPNQI